MARTAPAHPHATPHTRCCSRACVRACVRACGVCFLALMLHLHGPNSDCLRVARLEIGPQHHIA
jgi:hypothetical protein